MNVQDAPVRAPQMSVEEFEELERHAPETVWLEFIAGRLTVKRGPDGDRSEIVAWLQRLWAVRVRGPWLYSYRGLQTGIDGTGRMRADGVLAPARHFRGAPRPSTATDTQPFRLAHAERWAWNVAFRSVGFA
ncbi:hypothetical protein AB0I77_26830 [Streptomyces sp. NPDC050619]|uniref:hypothetical protein n=1 Tax=Streptomyces sp. NPDC050619 TaxID=3157214 RepID=UPI00341546C7